ncbi:MAG: non-hydrolyzing UDP-N-acetylglucosamine 2-epimerase [Pirellulales bacterium]
MPPLRPLIVFGTRPEAIKLAPVIGECQRRRDELDPVVCLTGQHRELLRPMVDYFAIPTDIELNCMVPGQSLAALTARCLASLDEVCERVRPDCVVAQGDTTTAMAASLAAFYRRIPFVHVEAGLRTGDLHSPWPEEMNRRVASLAAAIHCAPTCEAAANLLDEGVPDAAVHVTGNTGIDALLQTLARERRRGQAWLEKYRYLGRRPLVLVTGHRRENLGGGIERICQAIAALADRFGEVEFLYPVHLNPQVMQPVHRLLAGRPNVHLCPPASYPEFVWLMDRSKLILTDSGGIQEEAPSLRRPVLVTRDTTERPEAIAAGAAELVGTDTAVIIDRVSQLLTDPAAYAARQPSINPFGDGHAAERIVELIARWITSKPSANSHQLSANS